MSHIIKGGLGTKVHVFENVEEEQHEKPDVTVCEAKGVKLWK